MQYAIENEGAYSNNPKDKGGETFWGISAYARKAHRCPEHPNGLTAADFTRLHPAESRDLAKHVYRLDYWRFDAITDARLAIKLFDVVVNVGDGIRVIQRAAMVTTDGIYGPRTEASLLRLDPETAIERLCESLADHYVGICLSDHSQLTFLKGWMRRAVRRPRLQGRAA